MLWEILEQLTWNLALKKLRGLPVQKNVYQGILESGEKGFESA